MAIFQKIKLSLTILLILFFFNESIGQWNFNLETSQSYSDNPFQSPVSFSTMISSVDLSLEREMNSIGIGYYGNYSIFHKLTDRNFFWQQFGIWNSFDNSIYGLYLEQRFNGISYEIYNYTNYNLYLKNRFLFDDINVFINASVSLTDYSSLNDLDNILATTGLLLNKSFSTKTTLIGGFNYNYKNYFSTDLYDSELVGDSIISSNSTAFTSQISYLFRIAQSVSEKTGVAVQYSGQNIIGGTAQTIRQLEFIYGDESQYFDDPISYDGSFLAIQFTQMFDMEIVLRAKAIFGKKDYPSQGIYLDAENFDQAKIRRDELSIYDISLTKYFYVGSDSQNTINLTLSYQNKKNKSNSFWYDYLSGETSLTFGFQF